MFEDSISNLKPLIVLIVLLSAPSANKSTGYIAPSYASIIDLPKPSKLVPSLFKFF